MLLRSLVLENIRSYKDARIEFPEGTTLFEGDIGSGKSTILYAIEFALFGLGSLGGTFMLRNGASRGAVTMRFDIEGAEYEVSRPLLKKEKGVQQGKGTLRGPEGEASFAPSELKERILQILKFNEPSSPKAQSIVYRYAIFTPQEEMKEIILKDPDERLQTLRRVFRIEDYKIAAQNSELVSRELKSRIDVLRGATENLEEKKRLLVAKQKAIQETLSAIRKLETEEQENAGILEEIKSELEGLRNEREAVRSLEGQLPILQDQLAEKRDQLTKEEIETANLKKRIKEELEPKHQLLIRAEPPGQQSAQELKELSKRLSRTKSSLSQNIGKIDERLENVGTILEKSVCPVCERPVDSAEFEGRKEHLESEKRNLLQKLDDTSRQIDATDRLLETVRRHEETLKELERNSEKHREAKTRLAESERAAAALLTDVKTLTTKIGQLSEQVKPLQRLIQKIAERTVDERDVENKLQVTRSGLFANRKALDLLQQEKAQLQNEIDSILTKLDNMNSLKEKRGWMDEFFAPTIETIERHVMASFNQRFGEQFRHWFGVLIEEPDLNVRVSEDFTPIIEREGYVQDYAALSGGERTSVALAYRLALNTVVQEVATGTGPNLLILDEPTDGFSREQLFKIREILDELNFPQVIIVSHERELEGFADHVFRVEKIDHFSQIKEISRK